MERNPPYENLRNPNLPWGYWCLNDPAGDPPLVDETGRRWQSLREYLWVGRLGMDPGTGLDLDRHCEFLLAVLAALDRRTVPIEEFTTDFFRGYWDLARHYESWLKGQGVSGGLEAPLTPEGRAILVTLASTRAPEHVPIPIGLPIIDNWQGFNLGTTKEERERIFKQSEDFALELSGRFVRAYILDKPGIKLIGMPDGNNIPLSRVLWSLTFPDEYARDRLFAWLVQRLDRWEAWTQMAREKGARMLSEHFLRLRFANLVMPDE